MTEEQEEEVFDLKGFREHKVGMTQEQFAKLINVRQDRVSRMEKNPDSIGLTDLKNIALNTGTTLDELVGYKKPIPQALDIEDKWETNDFMRKTLLEYMNDRMRQMNMPNEEHAKIYTDIENVIDKTLRKPTVALLGMSDAGKSTMINALLGMEKMPTSWTPTTSISVHIKHISDRPSFITEEVVILNDGDQGFDVDKINNQDYYEKKLLDSGAINILEEHGTRQSDKYNMENASAAVIYLDSPILNVCDLVDLPGFGTGREMDDTLARKSRNFADIIIYLSSGAGGFLKDVEIQFLKTSLNSLPVFENKDNHLKPLENLFVVASQAHTVNGGNIDELENILNVGVNRFFESVPHEFWDDRVELSGYSYTERDIRKRFFTYTTDIPQLREKFEVELKNVLEVMPSIIQSKAFTIINDFLEERKQELTKEITSYQMILKERESILQQINEMKMNEPNRKKETHKARMNVLNKITEMRKESLQSFEKHYKDVISVDNIVDIIETKGYKKKKSDMESLAGFLSSKLQARMQNVIKVKSTDLNKVIDEYLDVFEGSIRKHGNQKLNGFEIPFNTVNIFAGGLAGIATLGGLAFWASTLGNLGGYILVAKGVSVLSAIGISVGGTASAATAVAAIGGPATLAIGIAVIVGLGTFMIASGGWRKSIAKKVVKEYEKEDALQKFATEIEKFWNETEVAYKTASDHLEEEWQNKLDEMSQKVSSYNIDDIHKNIASGEKLVDFLGGMQGKLNTIIF